MDAPRTLQEAVDMARKLMQHGPDFKQGYTLENAAIAVAEVFDFSREEIEHELRNTPAP